MIAVLVPSLPVTSTSVGVTALTVPMTATIGFLAGAASCASAALAPNAMTPAIASIAQFRISRSPKTLAGENHGPARLIPHAGSHSRHGLSEQDGPLTTIA